MSSAQAPAPFQGVRSLTVISTDTSNAELTPLETVAENEGFSLIFVFDRAQRKVLLGTKKRGYGQGLVHGFGGKIEPGETLQQCAERELWEESGLRPQAGSMTRKGRLVFVRPVTDQARAVIDIALFVVENWEGTPQETDEMSPRWYSIDEMPLDNMWPDVRLYFPPLVASVMSDRQREQLLVRVDYGLLFASSDSLLPPLRSIGIDRKGMTRDADSREEGIVSYWLAYN